VTALVSIEAILSGKDEDFVKTAASQNNFFGPNLHLFFMFIDDNSDITRRGEVV